MVPFNVTVLGCGSATPTTRHYCSSQVVNYGGQLFMVDCAEGTQFQFRRNKFRDSRLNHVFITHLHGDHCLGLIGLLSTFSLLGRTRDFHVFAPAEFGEILRPQIDFFIPNATFNVVFHPLTNNDCSVIFEDNQLTVRAFPLNHRVPCYGFLFTENNDSRHIIPECIRKYAIPNEAISGIKRGDDFLTADGRLIPNAELTTPPEPPRSFAYCSDTKFMEAPPEALQGVNLLYHESTYAESEAPLAEMVYHSTSRQAALFASTCHAQRLLIGHFSSRYDDESPLLAEAQAVFPETVLANENLVIEIG